MGRKKALYKSNICSYNVFTSHCRLSEERKMPSTSSHSVINTETFTPVPVIASFDTAGRIAPLYVRLNGEAHRVLSYWIRNKGFINTVEFSCKIADGDFEKPLLLTYFYNEATWVIGRG